MLLLSMPIAIVAVGFLWLASMRMALIVVLRTRGSAVNRSHYMRFGDHLFIGAVLACVSTVLQISS